MTKSDSAGRLSKRVLYTVVVVVGLLPFCFTILLPPWVKVHAKRQQGILWSTQVQVYSSNFAGYDFVFSGEKWRVPERPHAGLGGLFVVEGYQIFWTLLASEWAVIFAAVFIVKSCLETLKGFERVTPDA